MVDFCKQFLAEMEEFKAHAHRVSAQYGAVRELKERLPANHATIQMDFVENYTCDYTDEIQSAYYNKAQVTIHPVVVHYKQESILSHKSFVIISNDRNHTAAAVFAFIKKLVVKIKQQLPE